jgi:plasmid stabilization system protein ParE
MPDGNLHEYAVNAEENLEKLATGLAAAGADPAAIKTVERMADVTRKLVKALGKGQEQTGDAEPPPPEQPPAPAPRPRTIQSATEELRADAQAAARR